METAGAEDIHVCLKCNCCILGLDNYVIHRKSQCTTSVPNTPTKGSVDLPLTATVSATASSSSLLPLNLSPSASATTETTTQPTADGIQTYSKQLNVATGYQQHQKPLHEGPPGPLDMRKGFTCPGCEQCFDVELVYLVHLKACAQIDWPLKEDVDSGEVSDDNTIEYASSPDNSAQDIKPNVEKRTEPEKDSELWKKYGRYLDFRKCHPDGRYCCILCAHWTVSHSANITHLRSKGHAEAVHFFVEKKLGSSLDLFTKNAQELFECKPCGWQGIHRTEMERHILTQVHQDCIIRLIVPGYSLFGHPQSDQQTGSADQSVDQSDSLETTDEIAHSSVFDFPKDYLRSAMKHLDVAFLPGEPETSAEVHEEDEADEDSQDEVDKMLKQCLVKGDRFYQCQVCCYTTQRSMDMTKHMNRAIHLQNVKHLRNKLKNGEKGVIKKSVQWKMSTKRKSKDVTSSEQTNDWELSSEENCTPSSDVLPEKAQVAASRKSAAELCTETVSNSSRQQRSDKLPEETQVAATRRSGRTRKLNSKYMYTDSQGVSDDEGGDDKVVVKRKRGRPRKDEEQDDVVVCVKEDAIKRVPKRGRGRPRKDEDKDLEQDDVVVLVEEDVIKRIPKRGRGRPRKDASKSQDNDPKSQDNDLRDKVHQEEVIKNIPKRGRGRPRKATTTDKKQPPTLFEWTDFICEVCNERFRIKYDIELHIKSKSHKVKFLKMKRENMVTINCDACPSVFLSEDSNRFRLHREKHEYEEKQRLKVFRCEACPFCFLSQDALEMHTRDYCVMGVDDDDDNRSESEENEKQSEKVKTPRRKKKMFCCHMCNYLTHSRGGLQDHLDTIMHENKLCELAGQEKMFNCGRCGDSFYTKRALDAHLEKHTQGQQEFKICPTCGDEVLREHYKSHCETTEGHDESDNEKRVTTGFKCDLCCKVLATAGALSDHKFIHTGQRPYKCHMCPYSSRRKGDISIHVKRHLGIKPFKCHLCETAFVKKSSLKRHILTHDKNRPRPIECDLCDMSFYDRVILRVHKKNMHSGERPKVLCQEKGCTYACHSQTDLRSHMRSHTKEKPYLCTTCGRSTATSKAMRVHQRVHTGEKPFKCTYGDCRYASRSDTNLRRHILIHTGEKPYKCPHCPYRSNIQENLRKHIKTSRKHKGMKMYKCSRCDKWEGDSLKEMINHIRIDHGVYVKRLDVANETGIFQKNSGTTEATSKEDDTAAENLVAATDPVSVVPVVGVNGTSIIDKIPSVLPPGVPTSSQGGIVTLPLVLTTTETSHQAVNVPVPGNQHSQELVIAPSGGALPLEPTLSGQERGGHTIQFSSSIFSLFTIDPNDSSRAIAILK